MQSRFGSRNILSVACLCCAIGLTLAVARCVPIMDNPWPTVVLFSFFASLTELLAVGLDESGGAKISSTAALLWALVALFGVIPAVTACVLGILLSKIIKVVCHQLATGLQEQYAPENMSPRGVGVSGYVEGVGLRGQIASMLIGVGVSRRRRSITTRLQSMVFRTSCCVIGIDLGGLVYNQLGGRYLVDATDTTHTALNFVLPFVAMAATYLLVEQGLSLAALIFSDSRRIGRPNTPLSLNMKLYFLDNIMPIHGVQLAAIVVGLILAYLYAHIGLLGFILAVMPVLALRDFFRQRVVVRDAYVDTITTLATYMQHYHPYTRGHLKRVADISQRLAHQMKLPLHSIRYIGTAGLLHDIGKIGVSEEILDKPGTLTDHEWAKIREHPLKGAEIVSHLEYLEGTVNWIKYHHKWYNGEGYPVNGVRASAVPIESSVIAVADAFDAMTDDRELTLDWECDSCGYRPDSGERPTVCPQCQSPKRRFYREPRSREEAILELKKGSGTQFHPEVVNAFLKLAKKKGMIPDAK